MATKTVSIRMDEELYRRFSEFADQVYIPVSALVSSFAAMTVRQQRIPFDVASDSFYSPANQAHLSAAIDQLEAGHGAVHDLVAA